MDQPIQLENILETISAVVKYTTAVLQVQKLDTLLSDFFPPCKLYKTLRKINSVRIKMFMLVSILICNLHSTVNQLNSKNLYKNCRITDRNTH